MNSVSIHHFVHSTGFPAPQNLSDFTKNLEVAFSYPNHYAWSSKGGLVSLYASSEDSRDLFATSSNSSLLHINDTRASEKIVLLLEGVLEHLLGIPHAFRDLLHVKSAIVVYDFLLSYGSNTEIDFLTLNGKYFGNFRGKVNAQIEKESARQVSAVEKKWDKVVDKINTLETREKCKEYQHLLSLLNFQREACTVLLKSSKFQFRIQAIEKSENVIRSSGHILQAANLNSSDTQIRISTLEFLEELAKFDAGLSLILCSTFSDETKENIRKVSENAGKKVDIVADFRHVSMKKVLEIKRILTASYENDTMPSTLQPYLLLVLKGVDSCLFVQEKKKDDQQLIALYDAFLPLIFKYGIAAPSYYHELPLQPILDTYRIVMQEYQARVLYRDTNLLNFSTYYKLSEEYFFHQSVYERIYRVGYEVLFSQTPQKISKEHKLVLFASRLSIIGGKTFPHPDELFGKMKPPIKELPSSHKSIEASPSEKKTPKQKAPQHIVIKPQEIVSNPKETIDAVKKVSVGGSSKSTPKTVEIAPITLSRASPPEPVPSPSEIIYAERVQNVLDNPQKLVEEPRYKNESKFVKNKVVAFHTFSLRLDREILQHGILDLHRKETSEKRGVHYFLPGEMTVDEVTYLGVFGYTFDRAIDEKNLSNAYCYHRCFTQKDAHEMVGEYLEKGFWDLDNPSLEVGGAPSKKKKTMHSEDPFEVVKLLNPYTMQISDIQKKTTLKVFLIKQLLEKML
ncbi:MAG: hypothetical protein HKM07_02700 [Chlamydiae bacterium]|nr:hypothetical protein [Chlamydiota bacterium]